MQRIQKKTAGNVPAVLIPDGVYLLSGLDIPGHPDFDDPLGIQVGFQLNDVKVPAGRAFLIVNRQHEITVRRGSLFFDGEVDIPAISGCCIHNIEIWRSRRNDFHLFGNGFAGFASQTDHFRCEAGHQPDLSGHGNRHYLGIRVIGVDFDHFLDHPAAISLC